MINKQKHKVRIIRVQQKIVADIDYDKLAEAIIKANEKQSQKYSVSREWMKFIIYPVFWGVAIITGILAVAFFIYGAKEMAFQINAMQNADWKQLAIGVLALTIGLFLIAVSLSTIFTAKEIDKEKDRQYVATMFSNIVALVALVVSLIALVKG